MTKNAIQKAMKGVKADALRNSVAKDAAIYMKLPKADKAEMQRVARELGLTLSEYVVTCHRAVSERLGL